MRVFRGPSSKPFWDSSHSTVSRVNADELQDYTTRGSYISFNISHSGSLNRSTCTLDMDGDDITAIVRGHLQRKDFLEKKIAEISSILYCDFVSDNKKLEEIAEIVNQYRSTA